MKMYILVPFLISFQTILVLGAPKSLKMAYWKKTERSIDLPSFAPIISRHPSNITVRVGEPLSISCQLAGSRLSDGPVADLDIFKNGQVVQYRPKQTPNTNIDLNMVLSAMSNCCASYGNVDISGYRSNVKLESVSATVSHSGQYYCSATSTHGSAISNIATVEVIQ